MYSVGDCVHYNKPTISYGLALWLSLLLTGLFSLLVNNRCLKLRSPYNHPYTATLYFFVADMKQQINYAVENDEVGDESAAVNAIDQALIDKGREITCLGNHSFFQVIQAFRTVGHGKLIVLPPKLLMSHMQSQLSHFQEKILLKLIILRKYPQNQKVRPRQWLQ